MIRRTSGSSIWKKMPPAGSRRSAASRSVTFHSLAMASSLRPDISGCGIDQVIWTGTSWRSRSGISTVEPATYGYTSKATGWSSAPRSIAGRVSRDRPKFSGIVHLWWLMTTGTSTARPILSVSSIESRTPLASSRMWVT